jgi:predicted DNA-binding transcriptional regulator AlpA
MQPESAIAPRLIPTLDELLKDPVKVTSLPPEAARTVLCWLAGLLPVLIAQSTRGTDKPHVEDRLLAIAEAAAILGKTTDWLYRRANTLPFVVREGRLLRFSHSGIQKYIQARLRAR